MKIQFTVHGKQSPAGSKVAMNGNVFDACKTTKSWQSIVSAMARQAYAGPLLEGALSATFVFYGARPAGHFGSGKNIGKLKTSAPAFNTKRPDVLKLARAIEDSLTGVIYRDDAQIVQEHLFKNYGEPARCEVAIQTLSPQ